MPLIGVWSLAVYAVSAVLVLAAANRWGRPIPSRVALFLGAGPLLLTGRATVSGGVYAPLDILFTSEPFLSMRDRHAAPPATPLLSDVVCSMIPWHRAVREALTHGRLPLWNRFLLAG